MGGQTKTCKFRGVDFLEHRSSHVFIKIKANTPTGEPLVFCYVQVLRPPPSPHDKTPSTHLGYIIWVEVVE